MKNRWLAILLTLAMCLSLLPVTAMAEGEPQLVMCEPDWDSESDHYIEEANKEYRVEETLPLQESRCFIFYFGTPDNYTMIPLSDLQVSGSVELSAVESTEVIDTLFGYAGHINGVSFGTGTVSYSVDGATYSVTFQIGLPELGLYTAAEATQENYHDWTIPFSASKTDEQGAYEEYYLICTIPGKEIQEVIERNDNDISFLTVTVLEDTPNVAKLVIREGFEGGTNYRMRAKYTSGYNNFNLYINDVRPQLFFDSTARENGLYAERQNIRVRKQLSLTPGGGMNLVFYYGTAADHEKVLMNDLVISENLEKQIIAENRVVDGLYGYVGNISGADFGSGSVSYTADGKTHSVDVLVGLPDYALFSQQSYEEPYYLEDINLLTLKDHAVWLIHKDGFSAEDSQSISAEWLCEYSDEYCPETDPVVTPVAREDDSGRYDIKITLPTAAAACRLQVSGPELDEFWWVEMTGTSVQIGDYLIGYGSLEGDETNGYLTIHPNDYNRNTNSEDTSDERSGLGEWAIYAGTPTEEDDIYTPAPEVGIQLNKVWVEVIEGEAELLSWDEAVTPLVTDLYPPFDGTICGSLYRLNGTEGLGVIYSDITVTIGNESTNHTIASVMEVDQVASSTNVRPDDDTVDDLNAYLQKLKAQESEPGAADASHYEIYLPAVTYTGEIIVPAFEKGTLFFYGEPGQATVLEGCITMEEGANIHRVFDISFRAAEEYNDYAIAGGSGTIVDCSFYGYAVAIKSGKDFIRVAGNCAFVNNGIGYLHDSEGGYRNPYGNASFDECVFLKNGIAISLQNWDRTDPDPFYFRVSSSNFIGNDVDFDVQVADTFYFQGNYFGYLTEEVSDEDLLNWLDNRQLTNINEARRAAVVTVGNGANVITSPRWRNALDDMWWFKNDLISYTYSLRAAESGTIEENELICDWETTTQIVNGEAADLLISDSAFDIEGEQIIYVVDNEENPVATWDFN